MGTPPQPIEFAITARVSSLIINPGSVYDPAASSTYNPNSTYTQQNITLSAAKDPPVEWVGKYVSDTVCIAEACAADFSFFMADSIENLARFQTTNYGVLGLGPERSD